MYYFVNKTLETLAVSRVFPSQKIRLSFLCCMRTEKILSGLSIALILILVLLLPGLAVLLLGVLLGALLSLVLILVVHAAFTSLLLFGISLRRACLVIQKMPPCFRAANVKHISITE